MRVETQNTANSYTAQLWITGAASFTDAAPTNAASVAAARRITTPTGIFVTPGLTATAAIADGTSATLRIWWLDEVMDLWVPFAAGAALTLAAATTATVQVGCMPGCKFHCQVVANSGATKFAFTVR
jgi:hypothetical protein